MSDKKLLTESEMRRFMRLAAIEPLFNGIVKENYMEDPADDSEQMPVGDEAGAEDAAEEMPETAPEAEEGGEEGGADLDSLESEFKQEIEALLDSPKYAELKSSGRVSLESGEEGDEVEVGGDDEEHEEPDADNMGGPSDEDEDNMDNEPGEDEEADEAGDDGEDADEEETEGEYEMQESLTEDELVETLLKRVTDRLISEASAKKGVKAKMAAKKNSNGAKNGLKGHGPGNKKFGTSGIKDAEWKEGIKNKTDTLKPLAPSGKDIKTHGKSSKVTSKGKNTKKV